MAKPPRAGTPSASALFLSLFQFGQGLFSNGAPVRRCQFALGTVQSFQQFRYEMFFSFALFVSADQLTHIFADAAIADINVTVIEREQLEEGIAAGLQFWTGVLSGPTVPLKGVLPHVANA